MEHAHQAATSALSSGSRATSTRAVADQQTSKARLSSALLDNFWLRMAALYGNTWVSQYGASPDGIGADTWGTVLADLAPAQIAEGLRGASALGRDWPPSAPRFRALCLGIPTLAAVRAEDAARIRFRETFDPTPFFRLVWSKIDSYRYKVVDADRADRMLSEAYELASEHVMRGGALPEAPSGLIEAPAPEVRKPASRETVAAACADLEKILGSQA